jgi:hypothetical protein
MILAIEMESECSHCRPSNQQHGTFLLSESAHKEILNTLEFTVIIICSYNVPIDSTARDVQYPSIAKRGSGSFHGRLNFKVDGCRMRGTMHRADTHPTEGCAESICLYV